MSSSFHPDGTDISLSGGNAVTTGITSLKNPRTCASSSDVAGSEDFRLAERNLACSLGRRAMTENKARVQDSSLLGSGIVGGR